MHHHTVVAVVVIIAFGQITTMVLIGLWHGITWNFLIWGLWHGVGLFIHNRWNAATRTQAKTLAEKPALNRLVNVGTTLLTFHFVVLGWVFFALPQTSVAIDVFLRLFGL